MGVRRGMVRVAEKGEFRRYKSTFKESVGLSKVAEFVEDCEGK